MKLRRENIECEIKERENLEGEIKEREKQEGEIKERENLECEIKERENLQAALPVSQLSNAFESKMPQIVWGEIIMNMRRTT